MAVTRTSPAGGFADIDPKQINDFIKSRHPEVNPPGTIYVTFAKMYNLKAEVLVSMAIYETGWFTSSRWRNKNNPAGIKRGGVFASFPTAREGIWEHCRLIRENYLTPGTWHWEEQKKYGTPGTLFPIARVWTNEPHIAGKYTDNVISWANKIASLPKPPPEQEVRDSEMRKAARYASDRGIMRGHAVEDGIRFHPYWPITRAEFAVVLYRAMENRLRNVSPAPAPPDVRGHWAEMEIRTIIKAGWMGGYGDGTFRPDRQISRAETLSVLQRASAPGVKAVAGRPAPRFADVSPSAWYAGAVEWGYQQGWLEQFTENNRFVPNAPITRGEVTFLIWNMLGQPPRLVSAALVDHWAVGPGYSSLVGQAGEGPIWVPHWAVPALYSPDETKDLPYTLVEPEAVEPAARVLVDRPWLLIGGAAAVGGLGLYLALRR